MDLRLMEPPEVDDAVRRLFGSVLPWDRKGSMCLVHMDWPADNRRRARVDRFQPTDLFDPACPHCQPLLEHGVFVVFTGDRTFGVNPWPGGKVELIARRFPEAN